MLSNAFLGSLKKTDFNVFDLLTVSNTSLFLDIVPSLYSWASSRSHVIEN